MAMNLHHIITPPNLLDPMMKLSNPAPLTRTPGLPLITERYCLGILQAQHTVTLSTLGQQREPWFVSMEPTFSVFHSTTIPSQYQSIIPGPCPLLPPWKPLPIRANQIRNSRLCLSKTHVPPDSSSQPASVCCFVQTTGIRALFGNTPSYYTCYCQPEILPQDSGSPAAHSYTPSPRSCPDPPSSSRPCYPHSQAIESCIELCSSPVTL
ncbi:hypothetical protein QBC45DRAFT_98716 [Copromyces sp. CBS 386.78]|nr:hypothetical protein QBC45DRAFT_98716 [Copromyces sp. CBS 386.78]